MPATKRPSDSRAGDRMVLVGTMKGAFVYRGTALPRGVRERILAVSGGAGAPGPRRA
jgi:hypothetical protein